MILTVYFVSIIDSLKNIIFFIGFYVSPFLIYPLFLFLPLFDTYVKGLYAYNVFIQKKIYGSQASSQSKDVADLAD